MTDHIKNYGKTNQKPKLCAVETVNGIKFDGHFLCGMHSQQRQKLPKDQYNAIAKLSKVSIV